MKVHKIDKYIPMKTTVATYKRGNKNESRVFDINELDGFYVDNELDRTVHVTFEEEDVIIIDIYNAAEAAYNPDKGEAIGIIELNLTSGEAKFFKDSR